MQDAGYQNEITLSQFEYPAIDTMPLITQPTISLLSHCGSPKHNSHVTLSTSFFHKNQTNQNLITPCSNSTKAMATLTKEDEALIKKFIELRTDDDQVSVIQMPQ